MIDKIFKIGLLVILLIFLALHYQNIQRYSVIPHDRVVIKLDKKTGHSWRLDSDREYEVVWRRLEQKGPEKKKDTALDDLVDDLLKSHIPETGGIIDKSDIIFDKNK